ncbi:MAG: cytochrome c biosis protein CcmG, thiol:disulfide interchange protein DsbE [Acidimicrobiaceae bacterium]|jgi:cytochrome c biogenesis protein CcmG/thiol:disulfide interchange protein DsbE|nr:cytochrome c biosis protein CcmG, thiol:disulfide interchange protein DsbE [Acidimicrobiaceae bacterium]
MTSRTRRGLVGAVIAVGVVLVAVPFLRAAKGPSGGTGGERGQQAPDFVSTDLGGQPVRLSSYRGRPVILNFWASWCQPCRAEFPVLRQLQSRNSDVVILGVVFDDADNPARAFLRSEGATWPGIRDPKAQIAGAYGVHAKPGIPVSILVDRSGRVVDHRYGPLVDQAAADAFIQEAR